ncbi:MAG TPA: hypothetical protein VGT98_05190, partial [Candidatus Elarobacter sp.]|nr:hypothetical protein [Candidatus Elarobacter sp.]
GVRMIYPEGNGAERVQWAGYHNEPLFQRNFDNDVYNVVLGPRGSGPLYLYVIASRYPLDVARYVHRPTRLANSVGVNDSRSFYVDVAFDALVSNALSLGDETSWDADVYTLWPPYPSTALALREIPLISLDCGNGSRVSVPANYPFIGCPGWRVIPRPYQTNTTTPQPVPAQKIATMPPPTVLPTIIGVRRVPSPPDGKSTEATLTAITAVTGVTSGTSGRSPEPSAAPVTVIERPILLDQSRARERSEAWRETHQGRDHDGNRGDGRERARMDDAGGMRTPRLAPPPQLAPSPRLTPNPEPAPAPAPQRESPRMERVERAERPMASPPASSPAPAASTGHGAVNTSAGAPSTPRGSPNDHR